MLDKELENIPQQRLDNIYGTWLSDKQQQLIANQDLLHLTPTEAQWVQSRSTLKVAYHPNDFPYQFTDKSGLLGGISSDVLRILAQKFNLTLVPIANSDFSDILAQLNAGRIDAVAAVTCTPERLKSLNCTQPYSEEKWVMVTAVDNPKEFIRKSAKIAVVAQKFGEILTREQYSSNPIIIYSDNEPLLQAVIKGEADYAVISLSSASRLLQGDYLGKLRVIASDLDNSSLPVGFAIAKDNMLLTSIINKTMANISPGKLTDIQHKWRTVTLNSGISANRLALWTFSLLGLIGVIIATFTYWNRKLTSEVQQRKAIEEKLTYLTNNVDGILMQHLQRSDDPNDISILFLSENIRYLTGITADEFKADPQQLTALLRQRSDHKKLFGDIQRAVKHGYWQTELQLESAASQQRWLEIRSQVIEVSGGWQWTSILIDITAMKQQQLELERARLEAENATQAKSRFLAMMSHEIRTPISGILSLLELLEPHTQHNTHARGLHDHLELSAKNLLNIVSDVLDFSKIEAGKLGLSPAPCAIPDLISELIQPHIIHANQKGLQFRLWLAPNIDDQLECDALRIKQILNNLLNNATKFTEQGEITLAVDVIEQTQQQQTLKITVSDSGIGISEQDLGKLFQPFEQADASSERRFNGTGLGLSICRQLVHLMGGDITATSALGEGASFSFTLPAKRLALQPLLSLDLRCALIGIGEHDRALLDSYLKYWHCQVEALDDKDLSSHVIQEILAKQYDVIFLPQRWQADIESDSKMLSAMARFIFLTDSPLLSAEPCIQGWSIGRCPLVPQQILHALANTPTPVPLQPAQAQPITGSNMDRETAIAQNRLLLVAEDHPINQQIIKQQLQQLGFFPDVVENGLQALKALQTAPYALLLTDCHMPELDGYGLVKAIRKKQNESGDEKARYYQLPIIALTANTAGDAKTHIEHYGFDDYLNKPATMQTLSYKLNFWIGENSRDKADNSQPLLNTTDAERQAQLTGQPQGPLDISKITAMFGDLETGIHFIREYINSCLDDLETLALAIGNRDSDTTRLVSHRMKGAARMMEYSAMADHCETIEKLATTDKVVPSSLQPVYTMIDDLKRQVKQF